MSDFVVPPWAKEHLIGLTVRSVEEPDLHTMGLTFTDGAKLIVTAMPFSKPELDVTVIDALD